MTIATALFSKAKTDWETPDDLFRELDGEFKFTLDVCATFENAKCDDYFTPEINGLEQEWVTTPGTVWCNPPYSTSTAWIQKAFYSAICGKTTVMLLPARTGTKAFHAFIYQRQNIEIRFLKGRLKFKGALSSAPFDSMIVIFRGLE